MIRSNDELATLDSSTSSGLSQVGVPASPGNQILVRRYLFLWTQPFGLPFLSKAGS
jgi:hypothetical protein